MEKTALLNSQGLNLPATACKLPSEVEGELFSVERYCKTVGSSPVRVYLLTEGDTEDDVDSENSDDGVHSLATRTPPGQKRLKLVRK